MPRIVIEVDENGITVTDEKGHTVHPTGAMLICHNPEKGELFPFVAGRPDHIASGLGETFSRLGDDPYWQMVYKWLLLELCIRTGVRPDTVNMTTPKALLERWAREDAPGAVKDIKKGTFH